LSTLWLNNTNNTYSGGTIVSNGFLYAKYPASLPGYNDGRLTFGGDGGFVAMNLSVGTFGFTPDQIHDMYTASNFTTNWSGLSIDTSASDMTIGYDLTKPMSLVKQGTHSLTLAGNANTMGGNVFVYGGTLHLSSTTGTNKFNKLFVGYNSTNAAAFIQEGGNIDCGSWSNWTETVALGWGGATGYGYYRMNGGMLRTGWLSIPSSNGGNAVFDQYAGDAAAVANSAWFIMGWASGHAALNIYGGSMRNSTGNDLAMNYTAQRNSLNTIGLLGPTAVLDAAGGNTTRSLRMAGSATNLASVVNLNNGTLIANRIYATSPLTPSIFNFNGGTLTVGASTSYAANFLQGLTVATVYPGGAVFDTAGSSVSVNQCLLAPTGYGLSYLPLRSNGAGYIGAPVISNGVLALAVREALPTGSVVRVDGGTLNMNGYTITNRSLTVTSGSVVNGKLVCDSVVKTSGGQWTLGTSLATTNPIIVAEGTLKLQSAIPGLYEGTLNGAFNTTESFSVCSNVTVQLSTRMANTNAKQPTGLWGDYATYVYSGYIWNRTGTDATWTFGESIDDNTRLKIDNTVVISDGAGWSVPMTGTITLSPGAHAIDVRFGNGVSGAGLVNAMWWTKPFGFGIDFQGHTATNAVNFITNFVACTDPGDGSLLTCTATSTGSSNLIDTAASLVLGTNTLVDLDGYVQTLSNLSGFGTVSNGTLAITGTVAPGGTNVIGNLTLACSATLSGTLLVDVSATNSDRLIVKGNLNLSDTSTLVVANPEQLDSKKTYTIASVSGGGQISGKINWTNRPNSHWIIKQMSNGDLKLIYVSGTVMRLR
jgi:autotransporter-associated beta strand protein